MTDQSRRPTVVPSPLPESALLRTYCDKGAHTDCYVTEVTGAYGQAAFVDAFYTTALFKLERAVLRWLFARPSTDIEARQLAEGGIASFAAWRGEARNQDQLLLADFTGRTKSWLMVAPVPGIANATRTRLYFGSAVVPRVPATTGEASMGLAFHALLGFHKLYSRLLLQAARSRMLAKHRTTAM